MQLGLVIDRAFGNVGCLPRVIEFGMQIVPRMSLMAVCRHGIRSGGVFAIVFRIPSRNVSWSASVL
jgi:hypothetical protein